MRIRTSASVPRLGVLVAACTLGAGAVAGCSSDDGSGKTPLNVYAAASLKQTFTQIESAFEQANPDVDVTLNFAGSQTLVNQINQGADVDVLATADEQTMTKVADKVDDPRIFAANTLVIATQPGNPKNIRDFAGLQNPDIKTVVCAVEVPCGAATAEVEKQTGVDLTPVSEEASVTAVLTKVSSKEADAGLVYVTDAKGSDNTVSVVGDRAFANVVNKYPIATLTDSTNPEIARKFVEQVLGASGQQVLRDAGFSAAP